MASNSRRLIKKSVLKVTVHPSERPYVERRIDNPGGVIGNLLKVLEKRFNLTIKFVWSIRDQDSQVPTSDGPSASSSFQLNCQRNGIASNELLSSK